MRVLVLSQYPVEEARHGGQLRLRGLIEAYKSAGHDVALAGVLGGTGYPESVGFLPHPTGALAKPKYGGTGNEDLGIARLLSEGGDYYTKLVKKIEVIPDVIHVEQPWLFAFARMYAKSVHDQKVVKLIYGSQNVEFVLKREILAAANHPDTEELTEAVRQLELSAVREADAVICVSQSDVDWVKQHSDVPVQLASNGISPSRADSAGIEAANQLTQKHEFALFCGSAHQPNVNGFASMFGGGFGSLDYDQRLVIAGAAGYLINAHPVLQTSSKLTDNLIIAGMVSDECLAGLLATAHCIVLPITQGGGTNLKTAEALWAGKHIVATKVAMRGFEAFIGTPGITVEDSPGGFKRALRRAMQAPSLILSDSDREARKVVLWEACLQDLPAFVENIVGRAS
jgi:glycosyltransferase involved in cell wall biosynthesis